MNYGLLVRGPQRQYANMRQKRPILDHATPYFPPWTLLLEDFPQNATVHGAEIEPNCHDVNAYFNEFGVRLQEKGK